MLLRKIAGNEIYINKCTQIKIYINKNKFILIHITAPISMN